MVGKMVAHLVSRWVESTAEMLEKGTAELLAVKMVYSRVARTEVRWADSKAARLEFGSAASQVAPTESKTVVLMVATTAVQSEIRVVATKAELTGACWAE